MNNQTWTMNRQNIILIISIGLIVIVSFLLGFWFRNLQFQDMIERLQAQCAVQEYAQDKYALIIGNINEVENPTTQCEVRCYPQTRQPPQ